MNVQKINYQKELDKILKRLEEEGRVPTLLIHSCCAPCSSYVLEYLSRYFRITVLYYNPNIYPDKIIIRCTPAVHYDHINSADDKDRNANPCKIKHAEQLETRFL